MTISGETQVFGLLGRPVRHSLSPKIYNGLFAASNMDAVYVCFEVPPGRSPSISETMRAFGLRGLNLTVPFKRTVQEDLDEQTDVARAIGAINVLVNRDGVIVGDNTDAEGFVRGLEEEMGPLNEGLHAVVLGAGGAARAVTYALSQRRAASVCMLNRSVERAQNAVHQLRPYMLDTDLSTGSLDAEGYGRAAERADLVVNCTTGAASPGVARLDPSLLPSQAIWCDLNYWMADPPLMRACRDRGLRTHTGVAMLIHQAVLAFERFTGKEVAASQVRALLAE